MHSIANPLKSWNPADVPVKIKQFALQERFINEESFDRQDFKSVVQNLERQAIIQDNDLKDSSFGPLAYYVLMQNAANLARRRGKKHLSDTDQLALKQEHSLTHQSGSFYWAIFMVMLAATAQGCK